MTGEQLLLEYDAFLTGLARTISRRYHAEWLFEDLKQEGAIALLAAAEQYAPDSGADLLAFASDAVKSAMLDYVAENFLPLRLPAKRVRLLRRVAAICAGADDVIPAIQTSLSVSNTVAMALYEDYRTLFFPVLLDENTGFVTSPEQAYEQKLLSRHLYHLIETALTARERSVLTPHLGLGGNKPKTFAELAALLNYNSPSAAQKVCERALAKLREKLDSGEYGEWRKAKAAIRRALREHESDEALGG